MRPCVLLLQYRDGKRHHDTVADAMSSPLFNKLFSFSSCGKCPGPTSTPSCRVFREERLRLDHRAMFAEANMRPCYFRYGYDIAIPLLAKSTFQNLRDTAPQDRKYFATFKVSSPHRDPGRGIAIRMMSAAFAT